MITENRKMLVEALRSGKYNQCFNTLRKGDEFCAVGLALHLLDYKDGDVVPFNKKPKFFEENFDLSFVGITGMNDNGCSFLQIADAIEQGTV